MQKEEADQKAAEEAAAHEVAERERRIQESLDAAMPDEIQQKVQAALAKEMVRFLSLW